MKKIFLILVTSFALACEGAEPVAPFCLLIHHPDVRRTSLDLGIATVTNVIAPVSMMFTNGRVEVLALPIHIKNRSDQVITAKIAHEWHGGIWPPTDLGAAVKKAKDPSGNWQVSEVYLLGELGSRTESTVWQPGQSHEFVLRLNWPGTASIGNEPLIDTKSPGEYVMKVSLVFKIGNSSEYIESQEMEISVREK